MTLSSLWLPIRFVAAFAALGLSQVVREPAFAAERPLPLIAAVLLALLALLPEPADAQPATGREGTVRRRSGMAARLMAALALVFAVVAEGRHQWNRYAVRTADPERVASLGRHIVAGWRDDAEIRDLAARGVIGGVFVTAHNVRGRSEAEIAALIGSFQAVRRERRLPPLIVATDQEGGRVARLSPPLPRPATLREIARSGGAVAVEAHAREHGREMARLGITLNLAPVVDLDFAIDDPADRYSRISERAIDRSPGRVAEIAGAYCAGLHEAGVACTLKHFPGLGRARGDTHVAGVDLATSRAELEAQDWQPFRSLAGRPGVAIMLAHVRLTAIGPGEPPASISPRLIGGILRQEWSYDGVLITDDLCMRAIHGAGPGIGAGAVAALQAGADLALVSWDGAQVYAVLAALLTADQAGRLDAQMLARSRRRLDNLARRG